MAALGAREPGPRILARLAADPGPAADRASVIGGGRRVGLVEAARVNGAAMHVLDFEPMWNPATHSLSTILPALLALAESGRAGGDGVGLRLLDALVAGIEAQGRLRLASRQFEPKDLTFHPPGVVGPVGSALACGLLLGLDDATIAQAAGIAASRAGGLLANVGSMTKALHCGQAAASGLEAALLAQAGFTADADALAGPRGFGAAFFGAGFDPAPLTAPRIVPQIMDPGPAYKLYPSQYGTHFVIEAVLAARSGLAAGATVTAIDIHCPPMPYVDRPAPAGGLAGKFSFQYVAAAALLDGRVDIATFADRRRFAPDMQAMLPRVRLHPDPAREGRFDRMRVDAALTCADGARVAGHCDGPPGIWGRPIDPARLRAKATDCLTTALGPAEAARVMTLCDRVAHLQEADLAALMALLASFQAGRNAA